MFSSTSSSIDSVSTMQIAQTAWNERQITQSCTFSTVTEVLRLYLLCPCQPLLCRDCFDKRAHHGSMCLFQSYCQCKHCQPCKDTKKAQRKTALNKIVSFYVRWHADSLGKFYDAITRRNFNGPLQNQIILFLNLTVIILVFSTSVSVHTGSGSKLDVLVCLLVWRHCFFIEPRGKHH